MGIVVGTVLKSLMWYWADVQNEAALVTTLAAQGYAICDGSTLDSSHQDINVGGTYTLPDLRNCFLLGADVTKAAGTVGAAVGSGNESLAAGAPGPKGTGGENSHTLSTAELASHTHNYLGGVYTQYNGGGTPTGSADQSTTTTASSAAGSGNAHENRPKYYGAVICMKVRLS